MKKWLFALVTAFMVSCAFDPTTNPTPAPTTTVPSASASPTVVVIPPTAAPPCPPPGQFGCFNCSGHVVCVDPPAPPTKPAATKPPTAPPAPPPTAPPAQKPLTLADCDKAYGPGKMTYCQIDIEFQKRFGITMPGKHYANATQWAQVVHFNAIEANGLPKVLNDIGCNPSGWQPRPPQSIPIFGPFTGAQHEFGGNEFLSVAAQLAGFSDLDLKRWLAWGEYDRAQHWACHGVTIK